MLSNEIVISKDGVTRCNRKVMLAVPNVPNDVSKGHHNVEAYCGMPIVTRLSDNVKACPRCDKEPAVGNVHPRLMNSNDISLTPAELKECGITENPVTKPAVVEAKTSPVEGTKMSEVRKDVITFEVPLEVLEGDIDVAALLIKQASESLDLLPVTTFKESKRLIRLQEKLESLLKV